MDFFKDLFWDLAVDAALAKLFAAVPLFGWGPIGWVVSYIAHRFADNLYGLSKGWVNFRLIAFRNAKHQEVFVEENVTLKIVALEKGTDSEEFKIQREKSKATLSEFVRFDVAR